MMELEISTTRKREIVDLTEQCRAALGKHNANGVCHLFLLHTTAALTIADLDPGTDLDLLDAFDAVIPKLDYRHPHNPDHVPDHILRPDWHIASGSGKSRAASIGRVAKDRIDRIRRAAPAKTGAIVSP